MSQDDQKLTQKLKPPRRKIPKVGKGEKREGFDQKNYRVEPDIDNGLWEKEKQLARERSAKRETDKRRAAGTANYMKKAEMSEPEKILFIVSQLQQRLISEMAVGNITDIDFNDEGDVRKRKARLQNAKDLVQLIKQMTDMAESMKDKKKTTGKQIQAHRELLDEARTQLGLH